MPFEPIATDEKIDKPERRPLDLDDLMLLGCSGFVVASVAGYLLTLWPFFVFSETFRLSQVLTCCAYGMTPALLVGIVSARKTGLPGACGAVAGAMATGVFLYLRLNQMFLAADAREIPQPDYPKQFLWVLPLAWILLVLAVSLVAVPRQDIEMPQ